jgi:hypothetical protein
VAGLGERNDVISGRKINPTRARTLGYNDTGPAIGYPGQVGATGQGEAQEAMANKAIPQPNEHGDGDEAEDQAA